MSNPGVLYLVDKKIASGKNLRLEDNLGEAIHIHYGEEIRIDLTTKEFLDLEAAAGECLEDLLSDTGFKLKYFDPMFLDMISECLIDLESVVIEKIRLSELYASTKGLFGLPVIRKLDKSRVTKALNGSYKELNAYRQENLSGQTNLDRVNTMKDKVEADGYPFNDKYIVLFNDQNIIRDGQHRAACLYHAKGDMEIPIIRMIFKDGKHRSEEHPWVRRVFFWNPKRIKKLLKRAIPAVKRRIKAVLRRILSLLRRV